MVCQVGRTQSQNRPLASFAVWPSAWRPKRDSQRERLRRERALQAGEMRARTHLFSFMETLKCAGQSANPDSR